MVRSVRLAWYLLAFICLLASNLTAKAGEIHDAVKRRDLAKIKALLDANPEKIKSKKKRGEYGIGKPTNDDGFTPLHYAASIRDRAVTELLLEYDPPLNDLSDFEESPLHVAIGNVPASALDFDNYPSTLSTSFGSGGWNRYLSDSGLEVVDLLLKKGAKVDVRAGDGQTPLHFACRNGQERISALLLEHKADPNARDLRNFTPLHDALWLNRQKCASLLLRNGARIDTLAACALGKKDLLRAFLKSDASIVNARDRDDRTLIHWAVNCGQTEIVELLIAHHALVDLEDTFRDWIPLHYAARSGNAALVRLLQTKGRWIGSRYGWQPMHMAVAQNHLEVVEILFEKDANGATRKTNPEKPGYAGVEPYLDELSPLHIAAGLGRVEMTKLLLRHVRRVDEVDDRDAEKRTPLMHAAMGGHVEVARLLIAAGARVNATSERGETPLTMAYEYYLEKLERLLRIMRSSARN